MKTSADRGLRSADRRKEGVPVRKICTVGDLKDHRYSVMANAFAEDGDDQSAVMVILAATDDLTEARMIALKSWGFVVERIPESGREMRFLLLDRRAR